MKDLVFLGIQGCGKWTQAKLLLEGLPDHWYFEMGQTLRALTSNDNLIGTHIKNVIASGKMVEHIITFDLMDISLKVGSINHKRLVVDGFPRMMEQAQRFEQRMNETQRDYVIIHLELSEEKALERMIKRASAEGRADDKLDVMKERISIFFHDTMAVIKHFESLGKVITINADNSIENIQAELKTKLGL